MNGMKLLINRYFHSKAPLLTFIFTAAAMALVILFHADYSEETMESGDYLICKTTPFFIATVITMLTAMGTTGVANAVLSSRFMRAIPCAKQLYTVGISLFSCGVTLMWNAAINVVYAAFILLTGRDLVNIADMLTLGAIHGLVCSVFVCCMLSVRFGVLAVFPYYAVTYVTALGGAFNLSIPAAVILTAAAFVLGFLVNLAISNAAYHKGDFKPGAYIPWQGS